MTTENELKILRKQVADKKKSREMQLEERKLKEQLEQGTLKGISKNSIGDIIIAYEPIWAIGTGKNATPQQVEEVHRFIRELLSKMCNQTISENTRIIYGGSMKPDNAKELLSMPNVNGGLVGGASLDAKSLADICFVS